MDSSSKKDETLTKSIKWTVRPRRMKILVHKVDSTSKKDENLIKSIKWTVRLKRMKILVHKMDDPSTNDVKWTDLPKNGFHHKSYKNHRNRQTVE